MQSMTKNIPTIPGTQHKHSLMGSMIIQKSSSRAYELFSASDNKVIGSSKLVIDFLEAEPLDTEFKVRRADWFVIVLPSISNTFHYIWPFL
jgi:hypothetical protein